MEAQDEATDTAQPGAESLPATAGEDRASTEPADLVQVTEAPSSADQSIDMGAAEGTEVPAPTGAPGVETETVDEQPEAATTEDVPPTEGSASRPLPEQGEEAGEVRPSTGTELATTDPTTALRLSRGSDLKAEWIDPTTLKRHPNHDKLPPISPDQKRNLRESFRRNGFFRFILYTVLRLDEANPEETNIIIDGAELTDIAVEEDAALVPAIRLPCADLDDAEIAMFTINLRASIGRRWTEREMARVEDLLAEKWRACGRGFRSDLISNDATLDQSVSGPTVELVAKKTETSVNSVADRHKLWESPLTPDSFWRALDTGDVTRSRAANSIRQREQTPDVSAELKQAKAQGLSRVQTAALPAIAKARQELDALAASWLSHLRPVGSSAGTGKGKARAAKEVEFTANVDGDHYKAQLEFLGYKLEVDFDTGNLTGLLRNLGRIAKPPARGGSGPSASALPNTSPADPPASADTTSADSVASEDGTPTESAHEGEDNHVE